MPFEWDLRKNKSFCLDYKTCNFSKRVNKKDTCFNFSKGNRILIYVKEEAKSFSNSDINHNNSPELTYSSIRRDAPRLLEDIFMINKYKISELKSHLLELGINEDEIKNKTKNDLRDILRKRMMVK